MKAKQTEKARKRFKSSMREKKRYLVLLTDVSIVKGILAQANIEKSGWKIIETNKGKLMLRLNLKYLNKFKQLLASEGISCIGISGTIKKAKQKFWNKNQRLLTEKGLKITQN